MFSHSSDVGRHIFKRGRDIRFPENMLDFLKDFKDFFLKEEIFIPLLGKNYNYASAFIYKL